MIAASIMLPAASEAYSVAERMPGAAQMFPARIERHECGLKE